MYWYTLSNDFSIELIPKVAISSWPDSPFKTCDHLLKISFVVDRWTFLYWRELICKIKKKKGVSNTQVSYMSYLHKGDVARDDSYVPAPGSQLRRFLAQQSVSTSLRHCFERIQHCSGITTLCCPKNRRCESSPVTSPWVPHKNFLRQDTLTIINNYAWFLYVCYSYTIISKAALKTVGPSQR